MPQGGLSMFGAGLQLQQVTPGVRNEGNANLSGTMLASVFGNNQFQYNTTLLIGKGNTIPPNYTGNTGTPGAQNNLFIGEYNNFNFYTNNTQATVIVGSGVSISGVYTNDLTACVMVGCQTSIYSGQYAIQNNVVVGFDAKISAVNPVQATVVGTSAFAGGQETVAVGYLARAQAPQSIAVGRASTASQGLNICIGTGANDGGNANAICIGSGDIGAGRPNSITIGTNANVDVRIGKFAFATVEITGSRTDGSALLDLITKLAAMGLVTDSTTP